MPRSLLLHPMLEHERNTKRSVSILSEKQTPPPFRLLDLPKEVRQIIYSHLTPSRHDHKVPLKDRTHHITIVNNHISGIHILATSRQIHNEAFYILAPRLRAILHTLPTIHIEAQHIIGLLTLHDTLIKRRTTLLDRILACIASSQHHRRIHAYLRGTYPLHRLIRATALDKHINPENTSTARAILFFILRTLAYITRKGGVNTMFTHPPITLVLDIPDSGLIPLPVTLTTSLPMSLYYRLHSSSLLSSSYTQRPVRRRVVSGLARLNWLVRSLAFHLACICERWGVVGVEVRMKRVKGEGWINVEDEVLETGCHIYVMAGVVDAICKGLGLVYFGGMISGEEEGEG